MKALAIVDAGIGGLGTYRAIRAQSNMPIIYFSDSGFSPYGIVSTQELKNRLRYVFEFLIRQGVDKIVVACNAASCAIPQNYPAEGIIRHGIDAAKQSGMKNIGLIGGSRTVRSQAYAKPLRAAGFELIQRIAQPHSLHVESGKLDSAQLHHDLRRILQPLHNTEALLLACTHYPAINKQIKQYLSATTLLIDPAQNLADWVTRHWHYEENNALDRWFTTGDAAKLIEHGKRAFAVSINKPQKIVL